MSAPTVPSCTAPTVDPAVLFPEDPEQLHVAQWTGRLATNQEVGGPTPPVETRDAGAQLLPDQRTAEAA